MIKKKKNLKIGSNAFRKLDWKFTAVYQIPKTVISAT